MYYRTHPGQTLDDVVRTLAANPRILRRLNRNKIGPRGEIAPYTLLTVPTNPENAGVVQGAVPPPAARRTDDPARPKAAATGAEGVRTPSAAPNPPAPGAAARPQPEPAPVAQAPGADTAGYETRPSPVVYDPRTAAPLGTVVGRLVGATLLVVLAIYGFLRLARRFGWEASLARAAAPKGRAARREDAAPPAAEPPLAFDELLRGAARPRDLPDPAAPRQNTPPFTLMGSGPEANTITGTKAFGPEPDDEDEDKNIPETSLEDALRRRRSRA